MPLHYTPDDAPDMPETVEGWWRDIEADFAKRGVDVNEQDPGFQQVLGPTKADIEQAWNEGRAAAAKGMHFKDDCPYMYNRFQGMSIPVFDATKRPLMDAWFKAWNECRKSKADNR